MSKRTKALARAGLAAALGVTLLYLAGIFPSGKLALICAAGILTAFVRMDAGVPWSVGCFAATAVLALLLLPQKSVGLLYAAFLGYYPILKYALERLRKTSLRWLCKLAVFNLAFLSMLYLGAFAVAGVLLPGGEWPAMLASAEQGTMPLLILGGNAVFVLYDIALTRVILFYFRRVSGKLKL